MTEQTRALASKIDGTRALGDGVVQRRIQWRLLASCLAFAIGVSASAIAISGCQGQDSTTEDLGGALAKGATDAQSLHYVLTGDGTLSAGDHTLELQLLDAQDAPVDGLTVVVVPFMPAMGHGSPANPTVEPQGNGIYRLTEVMLEMSGYWVLNVEISGAVTDKVTIGVDVS